MDLIGFDRIILLTSLILKFFVHDSKQGIWASFTLFYFLLIIITIAVLFRFILITSLS